jgi:hypothetical protein
MLHDAPPRSIKPPKPKIQEPKKNSLQAAGGGLASRLAWQLAGAQAGGRNSFSVHYTYTSTAQSLAGTRAQEQA